MKTTIYLFTILLALAACKGKKNASADKEKANVETTAKEITDAEREAAIIEQMKNEKLPNEGDDYYEMVEKEIPTNAIARIQRTPCFGRCPIYTITVYEDNRVEYFGKKFTPREGLYTAEVSEEIIEKLITYANEIGYFEMKNVYDQQSVTDVPSTITSLRNEEGLKTVVDRFNAPEELIRFEKFFDSLFEELEWTKVQAE